MTSILSTFTPSLFYKIRVLGMTWFRMPVFLWAMYATSVIFILANPIVAITIFPIGLERLFRVGILRRFWS